MTASALPQPKVAGCFALTHPIWQGGLSARGCCLTTTCGCCFWCCPASRDGHARLHDINNDDDIEPGYILHSSSAPTWTSRLQLFSFSDLDISAPALRPHTGSFGDRNLL